MKAIIPAAGLGLRLLPLTRSLPKEMLPVGGKPAIQYIVEEAYYAGIDDITIVMNPYKHIIEDHFYPSNHNINGHIANGTNGHRDKELEHILDQIDIFYVYQKSIRGLGHAILAARKHIGNEPFAVLLPDDIILNHETALKQLMREYEKLHNSIIAIERIPNEKVHLYGIINPEIRNNGVYKIKNVVEKPTKETTPSQLAIVGRYIFTSKLFEYLEKITLGKNNEIQLADAINGLSKLEPVYGVELTGKRFDISLEEDWLLANDFVKNR